jgi:hypothetical protein
MRSFSFTSPIACCLLLAAVSVAAAQGKIGDTAPEFPPGVFTDAGSHTLSGLRGKVVALYFFEPG